MTRPPSAARRWPARRRAGARLRLRRGRTRRRHLGEGGFDLGGLLEAPFAPGEVGLRPQDLLLRLLLDPLDLALERQQRALPGGCPHPRLVHEAVVPGARYWHAGADVGETRQGALVTFPFGVQKVLDLALRWVGLHRSGRMATRRHHVEIVAGEMCLSHRSLQSHLTLFDYSRIIIQT